MEHLSKFFDYIVESSESGERFTKEKIEELLVPFRDIGGVDINISEYDGLEKSITEGPFAGRKYISVTFMLNMDYDDAFGGYRNMIIDDRIWEFLDELITFKSRLESDKVSLFMSNRHGYRISVAFLTDGEVDSELFEIEKFHNAIRKKANSGTTTFYHGLVIRLDKETRTITINSSMEYTDRKLNNLFRGLDISNFDIQKELREGSIGQGAIILIRPKS